MSHGARTQQRRFSPLRRHIALWSVVFPLAVAHALASPAQHAAQGVDAMNAISNQAGTTPQDGSCGGSILEKEKAKAPAFCSDPHGTVCPVGTIYARYAKGEKFKKKCLNGILKHKPPSLPKPIPHKDEKSAPPILPPQNLKAIQEWKKEYRAHIQAIYEAVLGDYSPVSGIFEEIRSHEMAAVDARTGLSAESKKELKSSLRASKLLTPMEFLDLLAYDTAELQRYKGFIETCGFDGMSENAFHTAYDYIVVCPGTIVGALDDATRCGAKMTPEAGTEEKPGGAITDHGLYKIETMPLDKLRVAKPDPSRYALPKDLTPSPSTIRYEGLAKIIAHELGHSIDAKNAGSVASAEYQKLEACLKKKSYAGLVPLKNYLNEIIADYWAAETMAQYIDNEFNVVRYFETDAKALDNAVSASLDFLCGSGGDSHHPSAVFRIRTMFGLNPSLRKAMGCPVAGSSIKEKTVCTLAGEVPVK